MEKLVFYPILHPILTWAQDRIFHLCKSIKMRNTKDNREKNKCLRSFWNVSQAPLPSIQKLYKFSKQTESSHSAESTPLQQGTAGNPNH